MVCITNKEYEEYGRLKEENGRLTAELAEYSISEQEADGGTSIYSLRQGLKQERAKIAELTAQVAGMRDGLQRLMPWQNHGIDKFTTYYKDIQFAKQVLSSPDPGEKYRKVVEAAWTVFKTNGMSGILISDLGKALAELEGRA